LIKTDSVMNISPRQEHFGILCQPPWKPVRVLETQNYQLLKSLSKFPKPAGNNVSTEGKFAAIRAAAIFIASVSTASEGRDVP